MTRAWPRTPQLQWRECWRSPLVVALLCSILLHLQVFFLSLLLPELLRRGWIPEWIRPVAEAVQQRLPKPDPKRAEAPKEQDIEIPLQFIEVDPALAVAEPPKQSVFTSTANTLAANPNPPKQPTARPVPKIDGRREDTRKTFDTTRPVQKPQPSAPEVKQEQQEQQEVKPQPKGGKPAGELAQAKPVPQAQVAQDQEQEAREAKMPAPKKYKSLAQARAEKGIVVGERMKQEGGVPRVNAEASFDVKASQFGEYSSRLTAAVQARWYYLLDEQRFALERTGKVVVTFRLHPDGTVSDIHTRSSTVGEIQSTWCELAIEQPAPYGRWPSQLLHEIGADPITVTFTFNYFN